MVSSFDDVTGLGEVTAHDGELLGFHCTAIADGTRSIPVGVDVVFVVVPGRSGRWEAADVSPG